ncbi:MAG: outer membrane lipid asymmetry maintenance protein MlaD [Candidatus Tectomicrobia bacterium]|nr:outer membrane lipid asymmetry maintenance protein MlaD [Candidatus Tectomicrobia bacterium]
MASRSTETIVGAFVLLGLASLAYLAINLGNLSLGAERYVVYAQFESAAGLKPGASVEVAGVEVGRVDEITLAVDRARVTLSLAKSVKLQDDAIASIRTKGIIGDKYVQISLGGSNRIIPPGGLIRETESPIQLEELIRRFVLGKV